MAHDNIQSGDLLIASITLSDPNFRQSVILLCEHDEQKGTYGLVLNNPVKTPEEVMDRFPFAEERVFQGGPVQLEVFQVLHPYGDILPRAHQILPGVWLGADFAALVDALENGTVDFSKCRFFLGYAGWEGDQLLDEFGEEAWLHVPATKELVLDTSPEDLWIQAVRQMGAYNPVYAHFPDDPGKN